jgi:Fic family protein
LLELPVVTPSASARKWRVAYATARGDLERLVDLGILKEHPAAKRRTFYPPAIIDATYGDEPSPTAT